MSRSDLHDNVQSAKMLLKSGYQIPVSRSHKDLHTVICNVAFLYLIEVDSIECDSGSGLFPFQHLNTIIPFSEHSVTAGKFKIARSGAFRSAAVLTGPYSRINPTIPQSRRAAFCFFLAPRVWGPIVETRPSLSGIWRRSHETL